MQLKLIKGLGKSEIVRDVATLSVGSVVSQLIPVLMSLVLARLYTPQDYGNLGVFINTVGILAVFVCGRYEYAIVRPKREVDALNLMALSAIVAVGVSLLTLVVFAVGTGLNVAVLSNFPCRYGLPSMLLFMAVFQILGNYALRCEKYRQITFSNILKSVTQALVRAGLGLMHVETGLITGAIAGWAGGSMAYAVQMRRVGTLRRCFSWKRIGELACQYKNFPCYLLPGSLLNVLSTNLPVLLFAVFYAKEEIGYFSMALGILYMPVSFIGVSLGQVFYKKASIWPMDQTRSLAGRFFAFTTIIGAGMLVVLFAGGEGLFAFLLGAEWKRVGLYSIYLSPWLVSVLCLSPLAWIFDAKDKQKTEMYLNLAMFLSRTAVILCGGYFHLSFVSVLMLYSVTGFLLWLVEGAFICRVLRMRLSLGQKAGIAGGILLVMLLWILRIW
ncbi:MAG: oligosaccharide flippase family protein [Bacteroides sp.]|nr:oligosaccharide flippase family protein [Ruminococcus flavefaciens]MCM1555697.1 oligosaccharide flippase family protein [Bacteroides sp.]